MKKIVEKYADLFSVRGCIGESWLNQMAEDITAYTKELGTTPNTGSPKCPKAACVNHQVMCDKCCLQIRQCYAEIRALRASA